MKSSKFMVLGFIGFLLLALLANSFFIVKQTEQALVLRFGKPVNVIEEPGLKFKAPFVDSVKMFDKRTLVFNGEPMTVILKDKDRLIVDAFVTYRINDPLDFYKAVGNEFRMNQRLKSILEKSLRDVLGRETLFTLLSPKRSDIMKDIRDRVLRQASGQASLMQDKGDSTEEATEEAVVDEELDVEATKDGFGVQITDVRIMRTDLPKETSDAIYSRMKSDRQKVAEKFRAEGQKESQIIRSEADKTRTIMLADAQKQSETIRGEGDGEATRIYADAFQQDERFFEFYRAMQAYRKVLKSDDTTLILSPDSDFLKHMENR